METSSDAIDGSVNDAPRQIGERQTLLSFCIQNRAGDGYDGEPLELSGAWNRLKT